MNLQEKLLFVSVLCTSDFLGALHENCVFFPDKKKREGTQTECNLDSLFYVFTLNLQLHAQRRLHTFRIFSRYRPYLLAHSATVRVHF